MLKSKKIAAIMLVLFAFLLVYAIDVTVDTSIGGPGFISLSLLLLTSLSLISELLLLVPYGKIFRSKSGKGLIFVGIVMLLWYGKVWEFVELVMGLASVLWLPLTIGHWALVQIFPDVRRRFFVLLSCFILSVGGLLAEKNYFKERYYRWMGKTIERRIDLSAEAVTFRNPAKDCRDVIPPECTFLRAENEYEGHYLCIIGCPRDYADVDSGER